MTAHRGILVAEVTWPVVESTLQAGAVAVLPVGAGSKAHGRHLPMNSDFVQAEWLGRELAQRAHVAVWPALAYGHYPAFAEFPGSISLTAATFSTVVTEILSDMMQTGARAVVVVNTGISTIAPLRAAARAALRPDRIHIADVYRGTHFLTAARVLETQAHGSHADELETSVMLAIAPDTVHMEQAHSWDHRPMQAGPLRRADTEHPNYAPNGVHGDPTRATAEKGLTLAQAMLEDVVELCRHV